MPNGRLNTIFTQGAINRLAPFGSKWRDAKQYFQEPLLLAILTATHSHSLETRLFGRRSFGDIHDGTGGRQRPEPMHEQVDAA
ncbi:hypothetical protein TZ53_12845 [Sphingobium sp. YBL2]|nr:hypothetical protein TZ53_12845 [Sphingobium sp. YBL2]